MNAQRQLRGSKPKTSKGRLKAFIYGESGSGKSYFCTHFPKPYYIDTEKGVERAKYVENIEKEMAPCSKLVTSLIFTKR